MAPPNSGICNSGTEVIIRTPPSKMLQTPGSSYEPSELNNNIHLPLIMEEYVTPDAQINSVTESYVSPKLISDIPDVSEASKNHDLNRLENEPTNDRKISEDPLKDLDDTLQTSIRDEDGFLRCPICNQKFDDLKIVTRHFLTTHMSDASFWSQHLQALTKNTEKLDNIATDFNKLNTLTSKIDKLELMFQSQPLS